MKIDVTLDYQTILRNEARPVHLVAKLTAPKLEAPNRRRNNANNQNNETWRWQGAPSLSGRCSIDGNFKTKTAKPPAWPVGIACSIDGSLTTATKHLADSKGHGGPNPSP
jgi:hypothetical protein